MRIQSINIDDLFGQFSYQIKFDLDSNLTFLTGPNGYGKTTILEIINAISKKDFFFFYQLDFKKIVLLLEKNHRIVIESQNDEKIAEDDDLNFEVFGHKLVSFAYVTDDNISAKLDINDRNISKAIRSIAHYNRVRQKIYDYNSEDMRQFVSQNPEFNELLVLDQGAKPFLILLESLQVQYIPVSRRMSRTDVDNEVSTIDSINNVLKEYLNRTLFDYYAASSKLYSELIRNVLSRTKIYTKKQYDKLKDELQDKINDIQKYGILREKISLYDYNDDHAVILSEYIDLLDEGLSSYGEILRKLNLFSDLIKKKEFANKRIEITPGAGISVILSDGRIIGLNQLSEGEKNEIIILYCLIFERNSNSILLIDEPENSLHVAWQSQMIEDIEQIAKITNLQVVIATHSPQILRHSYKKAVDLFGETKRNNEFN